MRSVEVLPQPEGPMMAMNSPFLTVSDTPSTALELPKSFSRLSSSSMVTDMLQSSVQF